MLKRATASSSADRALSDLPIELKLQRVGDHSIVCVRDWGVGMSKKVIIDHLLTIASDYWEGQFHIDFPRAPQQFSPAGKFGIGFLSVFMLGQEITVSSQRTGNERYSLSIRGLGKRAELREVTAETTSGTTVSIKLSDGASEMMRKLPDILPNFIPMLEVKVRLEWDGKLHEISPFWVLQLDSFGFKKWVNHAQIALRTIGSKSGDISELRIGYRLRRNYGEKEHNAELEAKVWPLGAPEYIEQGVRLLADQASTSILCLRGFALQAIDTPGFTGVINSADVTPDAARGRGLDFDGKSILKKAVASIQDKVSENLTERKNAGFIPDQLDFVAWCTTVYGYEALSKSDFPWVQVIEASGDSKYVSSSALVGILSATDAIYLGVNMGPISLSKKWRVHSKFPQRREVGICFSEAHVGYATESKTGSLAELWTDYERATLFRIFLDALSGIWQCSLATVLSSREFTHRSTDLSGFLIQPMAQNSPAMN